MLFNSITFAIFLPIVFALFWLVPKKFRWIVLFVASYYFYMSWNVKYVFLILFTTVVSYGASILIEKTDNKKTKKVILTIGVVASLAVLFFFKYFNFFSQSITDCLALFSIKFDPIVLKILLPVGISFYTFQTLGYVIDVYRGTVPAEKNFGIYATFISFFPQLVAGPIERTQNLLPQIKKEHKFDYSKAAYGMKLMVWGFFKKLVIADVLSKYVQAVYDNPQNFKGFALIIATLFFTIQIYCDFSGYSDIAIGVAKLFDIDLMTNFRSPYFSQSIKEFWSRWHISLSTWFKDYIYIPLGGNRVGKFRHSVNLLVTFLVSGLWHGANWTFVLWGGIHGFAQVLENLILGKKHLKSKNCIVKSLRIIFVFLFSAFAWIFFVSNNISDSIYVIKHLFTDIVNFPQYISSGFSDIGLSTYKALIIAVCLIILVIFDYINSKKDCIEVISNKNKFIRYSLYIIMLIILMCLRATEEAEFVYFQF